ncbi:MAG: NeuD/PglB/VioB family sugar acetyltransferase [Paracoccaceae bacterium]
MEDDLYIIGTGGLAREIADMLPNSNLSNFNFRGFISESNNQVGDRLSGHKIVGSDLKLPFIKGDIVILVIAIGLASVRLKVAHKYQKLEKARFPNVIDNTVRVSKSVTCGQGNLFLFNSFISSQVVIGNFNLFNWHATLGHDVKIGSGCIVNPHAHISGHVVLQNNILIGAGAAILENLRISSNVLIGAGAVVTKDLDSLGVYVGVPAKLKS